MATMKVYTVCDYETGKFLCHGNAADCAAALGIKSSRAFLTAVSRDRTSVTPKYDILESLNKEEETEALLGVIDAYSRMNGDLEGRITSLEDIERKAKECIHAFCSISDAKRPLLEKCVGCSQLDVKTPRRFDEKFTQGRCQVFVQTSLQRGY